MKRGGGDYLLYPSKEGEVLKWNALDEAVKHRSIVKGLVDAMDDGVPKRDGGFGAGGC